METLFMVKVLWRDMGFLCSCRWRHFFVDLLCFFLWKPDLAQSDIRLGVENNVENNLNYCGGKGV